MDANTDAAPAAEAAPPSETSAKGRWLIRLQAGAHIAEIVGVIVVVASLFYLSTQVQQNTIQLQRADSNATQTHWQGIRLYFAADRSRAEFWSNALNGAELDAPDRLRFNALMSEHTWATYQIWDSTGRGVSERNNFINNAASPLARLICTAGGRPWWTRFRVEYPPPFAEDMDKALANMLAGPGSGDPDHPCGGPPPVAAPAVEG